MDPEATVATRDAGYAPARWAFDDEVTRVFDDMLKRSIPQYDVMRAAVFDVGSHFVTRGSWVVDLGAARGEALAPFVDRFMAYNRYVAVELSPPMLAALRERFAGILIGAPGASTGLVDVRELDLRKDFPRVPSSLTLSILTLQFTPIEHRQRIVRSVYDGLTTGGAFVLVEKVLGSSHPTNELLVELYHASKGRAGYSLDEIERKRLALEGVLVPISAAWNEAMLADFSHVECFWRWMNFAAWLAIK